MNRKMKRTAWVLAAALGMAMPLAAFAGEVNPNEIPGPARHALEEGAHGGKKVAYYNAGHGNGGEVYMVHYEAPNGKRMEIKVLADGQVISQGETLRQRREDQKMALENAKTAAERQQVEADIARQRDAEDKALLAQMQAMQQHQQAAPGQPAPAQPAASHQGANENVTDQKQLSEEYNSRDRQPAPASALPPGVKKTFDMETVGTKNIDYYKYTVDGQTFYSAHYDEGPNARWVTRVSDSGKLLGKNEINMEGGVGGASGGASNTNQHNHK